VHWSKNVRSLGAGMDHSISRGWVLLTASRSPSRDARLCPPGPLRSFAKGIVTLYIMLCDCVRLLHVIRVGLRRIAKLDVDCIFLRLASGGLEAQAIRHFSHVTLARLVVLNGQRELKQSWKHLEKLVMSNWCNNHGPYVAFVPGRCVHSAA
jgi:hypothetical protein